MSTPRRTPAAIAADVLACALAWEGNVRLIGDVTALELAELAAHALTSCPQCGSEAFVNIDCTLCTLCSWLVEDNIDAERIKKEERKNKETKL